LEPELLLNMYKYMLLARKIDEKFWLLNRAGKIPFMVSCQGHEALQVGAAFALEKGRDYLCPYYRDLAMVLVFGQSSKDQMLAAFAKVEDPNSGGRQMPCHYGDKRFNILSTSSVVASQVLHAVGIAYALKLEKKKAVVLTSLGDGATSQGDFHEACNFAGIHKLPVIFLVENNGYAISVPLHKQVAGLNIYKRAFGYGFEGINVDGLNPIDVYSKVSIAVENALLGKGPSLIEGICYRLTSHSSDDDQLTYREKEELENLKTKDPIIRYKEYLYSKNILNKLLDDEIHKNIEEEIEEAIHYAENSKDPASKDLYKYVYSND